MRESPEFENSSSMSPRLAAIIDSPAPSGGLLPPTPCENGVLQLTLE